MKKFFANLLLFALAFFCILLAAIVNEGPQGIDPFTPNEPKSRDDFSDTLFADDIDRSLQDQREAPEQGHPYQLPSTARAESLQSNSSISRHDIKNRPADSEEAKGDKGYFFLDSKGFKFAATKLGLDYKHHFLNSFLVGYHPFEVSEPWMPHQVLRMRLKYQLDKDQFTGFEEVWLSSYQAFQAGRGDCEDHSIALADWLIEMGEDARVVTGTHNGGGHAWVIVIRETGTFLLEATRKRRQRLWSSYPLASLARGYVPSTMFNREHFWATEDKNNPSDYLGSHWVKSGKVIH